MAVNAWRHLPALEKNYLKLYKTYTNKKGDVSTPAQKAGLRSPGQARGRHDDKGPLNRQCGVSAPQPCHTLFYAVYYKITPCGAVVTWFNLVHLCAVICYSSASVMSSEGSCFSNRSRDISLRWA